MLLLIISNSSSPRLFLASSLSSMPSPKMSIASKANDDDDDDDGGAANTTSQSKLITSSPSKIARGTRPILGKLQHVLIRQVRSILTGDRDEEDVFLRCTVSSAKTYEDLTSLPIDLDAFITILSDKVHPSHLETRFAEIRFRSSHPIGISSISATWTGATLTDLMSRGSEEPAADRR